MELGYSLFSYEILHVTQKCKNSLTLIFWNEIHGGHGRGSPPWTLDLPYFTLKFLMHPIFCFEIHEALGVCETGD